MRNKKNIRILIAEDDYLVSEDIARIIRVLGYTHIGTAPNGRAVLQMTKELKPDLILMDINMPDFNGLEASKIIQKEIPTPIVILTAHESQSLVEEAANSGIGAYLTKPPIEEELERAITIACARQNDIIQSRELIKQLRQKEKELMELNENKDKFFSIIAHDLRNPVSILIGYSNLMLDSYKDLTDNERIKLSESIKQLSKNIGALLESLLTWSRFEMGKMEFNPREFQLNDVLMEVIKLLNPNAEAKNISMNINLCENNDVIADINMFKTIIRNLLSNAIKFTNENGKIDLSTTEKDGNILISVSDNGIGMSHEQINNLFKIGNTKSTEGTRKEKGTGLGLILCKELIEKNEGTLVVKSKKGEGSTFSFTVKKSGAV